MGLLFNYKTVDWDTLKTVTIDVGDCYTFNISFEEYTRKERWVVPTYEARMESVHIEAIDEDGFPRKVFDERVAWKKEEGPSYSLAFQVDHLIDKAIEIINERNRRSNAFVEAIEDNEMVVVDDG